MPEKINIKRLYVKNHEVLSYGFFGVLTTVINYVVYIVLVKLLGIHYIIGNIIAWVAAVSFAFVTNKFYVFRSKSKTWSIVIKEFYKFVFARIATGVMETVLLWIFVDCMHLSDLIMKIITNILVIIGNFVLNKFLVFKKKYIGKENVKE